MNTTKRNLMLLLTVSISVGSSVAMAGSKDDELDITMTVMDEDRTPADFVQRIELPQVQGEVAAGIGNESVTDVTEQTGSMVDEVAETVTGSIRDEIVIGDKEKLPSDIVDNLGDDLPVLSGDSLADTTGDTGSGAVDTVSDTTGSSTDTVSDTTGSTTDTVSDTTTGSTTDTVNDTTGSTTDTTDSTGGSTVNDTTDSLLKDATSRDQSKLLP